MRLWEQIDAWKAWPGWRRYAPAGGTVFVHGVALAGMAAAMAAAPALEPARPAAQRMMAVELLPEEIVIPAAPEAGVTPPPRVRETPAERKPATGPRVTPGGPTTPAPAEDDGEGVYLGPPSVLIDPNAMPGLRGLAGNDPCAVRHGPKPRECAGKDLAARTGTMDSVMPRSQEDLAQHFAEYMPTCRLRVGCEGGEWLSTNGTRSVGKPPPGSANDRGVGTPGAGGAAGLGGLHTSVGRLGFNPDHTDPGFGD